jgi:hypothetical protein
VVGRQNEFCVVVGRLIPPEGVARVVISKNQNNKTTMKTNQRSIGFSHENATQAPGARNARKCLVRSLVLSFALTLLVLLSGCGTTHPGSQAYQPTIPNYLQTYNNSLAQRQLHDAFRLRQQYQQFNHMHTFRMR